METLTKTKILALSVSAIGGAAYACLELANVPEGWTSLLIVLSILTMPASVVFVCLSQDEEQRRIEAKRSS